MKVLKPNLRTMQMEYVLVQAFKKTVSYIRGHNWFADTLELDLATVDYPSFLKQLKSDITLSPPWNPQLARLIPAPKSAAWWINKDSEWEPRPDDEGHPATAKLRPLAHVPLRDQVVATAIMMCLADRIETIQGDTRLDIRDADNRKRVVSYGNRLFCDEVRTKGGKSLRHRWGSSKLYRSYYTDYRSFISRPEIVANQIGERSNSRTIIVHSDLSKFYDRVRPSLLHAKLKPHFATDELQGFKFAKRVLNWSWHEDDAERAKVISDVPDYDSLALPQGLVASGFFANVVLLDFDDALRAAFDTTIQDGIVLRDAARYVDDLRFVVEADPLLKLPDVEKACHTWIEETLRTKAPGLKANGEKTHAVAVHDSQRVMIFQSRRMRRIQETVSGGFDAHGGTQLLAALEGLFNTIGQFVETDEQGTRWPLKAVPDVRDETVARFVAGRYRSTFRSLRPLLEDEIVAPRKTETDDDEPVDAVSAILTKDELDRQSQAFGLRLIEEWIRNPGNVRLLLVGLDLFPDSSVLESVLELLKPAIKSTTNDRGRRNVAEYCMSEVFRKAATETGLVPDKELLPDGVDVEQYQHVLRDYARELMAEQWNSLSWYLRQQVLLFLATTSPVGVDVELARQVPETIAYADFLAFLQGQPEDRLGQWAVKAVLARQSFLDDAAAARLILPQLTKDRLTRLAELCPAVAEELLLKNNRLRQLADKPVFIRLSMPPRIARAGDSEPDLPLVNESRRWDCRLRDEFTLIKFTLEWLGKRAETSHPGTPSNLRVAFSDADLNSVRFETQDSNSLFEAPAWCPSNERWRFELGLLLRFIITGQSDPTETQRHPSWRDHEHCYRSPSWHWIVRRNSLFNGREGLGPEWIPLSSWMESFLSALLHWPGALQPLKPFHRVHAPTDAERLCRDRIKELVELRGESTGQLILPVIPRSTWGRDKLQTKSLRICVAQMAVPEFKNGRPTEAFSAHDPEFNAPATRHMYRRHLTAMLAGVDQMLRVRNTHKENAGLDFLILPELSVHPHDVKTRLLPFVRKHGCWVFAGLTYHRSHSDGPLVNSGLWIVPESSPSTGVTYRLYEQGKQHLAPDEIAMLNGIVEGHRPCQWLLRWKWSASKVNRPLNLTGSICYDATDLSLASDLKLKSDIYVIPALNRDVGTFDRMTDALHYHMYQMVILANHAHFGGSNAYVPYREQYQKQIFHLHGQDEAIVAFFEVDDPLTLISRGGQQASSKVTPVWKTPPAGWSQF